MPVYVLGRITIALLWIYQGLVPKLLGPHPDELALNMALGFDADVAAHLTRAAGVGEVLFGLAVLACALAAPTDGRRDDRTARRRGRRRAALPARRVQSSGEQPSHVRPGSDVPAHGAN